MVTGGAGAIGINLLYRLLETDVDKILVLDDLSSGQMKFMPEDSRIIFKHVDIGRSDKVVAAVTGFDPHYVFHLAAHFANQNSVDFPISDIQTNILGTVHMLEALKEVRCLKKFVNASSSCVYGNDELMSEEMSVYPFETPYAINKLTAELYTKYYAEQFGLPSVSVRIFNTYGPNELPGKYRNVIPNFIDATIKGQEIVITGTGDETRDFTYASDTANLLVLAGISKFMDGNIFNGGTGKETRIGELAEKIIKYTSSNSKIRYVQRRDWDHVEKRMANIEQSKNLLGYQPEVSLDEGLKKTIQWHLENR